MISHNPIFENRTTGKLIRNIVQNWWIYLLFLGLSFVAAWLYIRYTTPAYEIYAKILIKDDKRGGDVTGSEMFRELDLIGSDNSVENEVELLKSRTLMEKTLESLDLHLSYFREGTVKKKEVYHRQVPIVVKTFGIEKDSLQTAEIIVDHVNDQQFSLAYNDSKLVHRYGDTISLPFGNVIVFQNPASIAFVEFPVLVKVSNTDRAVEKLLASLIVAPTGKTVSTIDITFVDALPERGEEIVNTMLFIYDRMNSEDKNRVADSTITFIDERLKIVTRELGDVEGEIQGFRQSNEMTDINSQSRLLLESSGELNRELNTQEVQIEIVKSMQAYLQNNDNTTRLVPATLTIQDQTLSNLVLAYNNAQLERDRLQRTTAENNPVLARLNEQIPLLKKDILANLEVIRRAMEINRNQLSAKIGTLEKQKREVPRQERLYLEYSRQQAIKQELYLYLLKKREETAVSKSANLANTRIIDAAKSANVPFKPRTQLIYLIAFVAGICIPVALIYLRDITNTRIINKTDISEHTRSAIIAEIGHNSDDNPFVVREGNRSLVSEQFRALRTNLQYLIPQEGCKTVLITSSMSGEGKSFVAINLANALVLSGKRVVLMELDLRKPRIAQNLNIRYNEGFTTYAIGKADIEDVLIPVTETGKLWLIPSGPLPPNPSEILMLPRVHTLMAELKKRFEYIIIDSAPVGLVTDAQVLGDLTDMTLFLVRQNYTFKHQISLIDELGSNNKLPKLSIVVNDVKVQKGFGYTYGYDNAYYGGSEKKLRKVL